MSSLILTSFLSISTIENWTFRHRCTKCVCSLGVKVGFKWKSCSEHILKNLHNIICFIKYIKIELHKRQTLIISHSKVLTPFGFRILSNTSTYAYYFGPTFTNIFWFYFSCSIFFMAETLIIVIGNTHSTFLLHNFPNLLHIKS